MALPALAASRCPAPCQALVVGFLVIYAASGFARMGFELAYVESDTWFNVQLLKDFGGAALGFNSVSSAASAVISLTTPLLAALLAWCTWRHRDKARRAIRVAALAMLVPAAIMLAGFLLSSQKPQNWIPLIIRWSGVLGGFLMPGALLLMARRMERARAPARLLVCVYVVVAAAERLLGMSGLALLEISSGQLARYLSSVERDARWAAVLSAAPLVWLIWRRAAVRRWCWVFMVIAAAPVSLRELVWYVAGTGPFARSDASWILGGRLCDPLCIVALGILATVMMKREDRLLADPALCRSCGYNLTGNVSGVCPECGTQLGAPVGAGLRQVDGRAADVRWGGGRHSLRGGRGVSEIWRDSARGTGERITPDLSGD